MTLRYADAGWQLGEAVARYFGEEPHQQLDDDLRRFKQVLETGEVVRSEGAPGGKRARQEFPQHPARPLTDSDELAQEVQRMRANCWIGPQQRRGQDVPDPAILNERDAIVKVTSTAICGSDLHLLDGYVPTMQKGDVLGHEFMGEVVEVGPGVNRDKLRVGDRVVVPFPIACGACCGLPGRAVLLLREHQPQRRPGREVLRPPGRRHLRLLPPDRRLRRRAGASTCGSRSPTSAR